jgi:hypothetical protein
MDLVPIVVTIAYEDYDIDRTIRLVELLNEYGYSVTVVIPGEPKVKVVELPNGDLSFVLNV